MSYKIKNKAKQPIVCTLGDNTTLRLKINGETTVSDKQMTGHLENLASKNLLVIKKIVEAEKKVTKNSTTKNSVKNKEEK